MSNDPGEPTRPVPASGADDDPWKAFQVVPATPEVPAATPVPPTRPLQPADPYGARTVAQPARVEPVVAAAPVAQYVTADPAQAAALRRELVEPDRGPIWIAVAAVAALLVGGLVGYLIGNSSADNSDSLGTTDTATVDSAAQQAEVDQRVNDVFTLLAAEARNGAIATPTPYPGLDDLLGVLAAGAGESTSTVATTPSTADGDLAALTAERDQLAAQVTDLQDQVTGLESELATTQTALMELQATASSDSASQSDLQAQIDEQTKQIASLQSDLNDANGQLTKAQNDLQTAQTDLATANATLDDLNPTPLDNFVGVDIVKVRATVKANDWVIVERQVDAPGSTPNTVTLQNPVPGATMVKGSVVYVEVVKGS